jgi:hypothetical protein
MKTCKDKACIRWKDLDGILHALKSDLQVINGLELTIRQTWVDKCPKADLEPIISQINRLRWRIQDRVEQLNDVVNENNKE